ncbi:MAG: diacylglycerol kinase family lipid kinase [Candidatus Vecturithrix sp.]|jgi:diacylglycerol kinase family enzyme|nr:diacylglycerol kinase family lipid kinase [Candidatus Vecturithrix sp.]
MQTSLSVIINRNAGNHAEDFSQTQQQLVHWFRESGREIDLHPINAADLKDVLEQVISQKPTTVVVGGGDGTLHTTANALARTDISLGILPLGTFNHFAKDLELPLDLEEAIHTVSTGTSKAVDLGEVNGHLFLNNASIGMYPLAVTKRDLYQKLLGLPKLPAMGYAFWRVLWRFPLRTCRIQLQRQSTRVKTPFLFIGNNRYEKSSLAQVQRRSLTEGHLHVLYTIPIGPFTLVKMIVQILFSRFEGTSQLENLWTNTLIIESHKATIKVGLDGEVMQLTPPLHFRSRPGALKVIVPSE